MLKHYLTSCLLLSLLLFSNCSEDEFISDSLVLTNLEAKSGGVSDTKEPVLNNVSVNGSKVTLNFTNHASPAQPEGGFELIMDGKRTKTNITDRIFSGSKNVSMSFTASNPTSHSYQIYARWNSGYKSSNELSGKGGGNAPGTPDDDNDQDLDGVKKPSNIKQPVIKSLTFNGKKVTINFVNFAAPRQPEGGYELMLDGKRTNTDITPRVNGSEQVLSMSFTLDKPDDHFYQIYARWQSGYIGSKRMYPGQATSTGGEDDKNYTHNPGALPPINVLKTWNFSGSSQTSEGSLRAWGRKDGSVENVAGTTDGRAAKFFIGTQDKSRLPSTFYRMELVTQEESASSEFSNYFSSSKGNAYAKMDKEIIYQFRIKLSDKWKKDPGHYFGDGYTSLFEFKQDYYSSRVKPDRKRDATFRLRVNGNKYNFIFRATDESFKDAPRDKKGTVVQYGQAQVESIDASNDFGQWVLWTVHAKWSANKGFIRVYKDNNLVYSRENTYTAYDDESWLGPYMKFGLYDSRLNNEKNIPGNYKESFVDFVKIGAPK